MPNYKAGVYRNFNHSRARAIRAQCLECSGDNASEVRKCTAKGCALWAFRLGYEVDEDGTRHKINASPNTHRFTSKDTERSAISEAGFDADCEDDEMVVEETEEFDG